MATNRFVADAFRAAQPERWATTDASVRFIGYLVQIWWHHIANMRNFARAPSKRRWMAENVESILIAVFTLGAIVLVILTIDLPWSALRDSEIQPTGKWRLLP